MEGEGRNRAPRRPCRSPNCGILGTTPYCAAHTIKKEEIIRDKDRFRGTAASRGYDGRWAKARNIYIKEHPLCVMCEKEGHLKLGNTVDHIIPHCGDQELFWNQNNWQTLCGSHHSTKSSTEDGAYGNPKKNSDNGRIG